MTDLPIEQILPELREALRTRTGAVLEAPPGAGKTTRVPLALLDEPWLAGRKIVMLEPRRLAARAAAQRMASTLGERVGERVGYRMRMETRSGPTTRIEVVTEGVLTRFLQSDPALEDVGIVIFDELHERSLQADLGLALALQSQSLLRDDLRILAMSATLDGAAVAAILGDAPVITSEGRSFPVETHYLERRSEERIERQAATAVVKALAREEGDILLFLPGAGEIRRTAALLEEANLSPTIRIAQLHGMLAQEEQDLAIEPSPPGRRKVVLATSIAETSLTIEGIRVVIDSGLMRVPRFSPRSGMTRLETLRVSRASADQRRGRAGRLGPGVCYRLWTAAENEHLLEHSAPEILEADLAPLALDLAEWGVGDPGELAWIDQPPRASFAQARELLAELGALDRGGTITEHGRRMARLALHPRLAHMLLEGKQLGHGGVACNLAALLSERDIFRATPGAADSDLRLRLEALRDIEGRTKGESYRDTIHTRGATIDRGAAQRALQQARTWRRQLEINEEGDVEACGLLLAFAYPDRIGGMRPGQPGRFLLRNGAGAHFTETQLLAESSWIVVADLDGQRRESRIFLAAPITLDDIEHHFGEQIESEDVIAWDDDGGVVRSRRRERLGALLLREASLADPDPERVSEALVAAIEEKGLTMLPWTTGAQRTQERMIFMHKSDPTWPDVGDDALFATMRDWLAPHLLGIRRREELARLDLTGILLSLLSWEQRAALDELAPTHLDVPSGSRIPIDYSNPEAPLLAVRLQELFGMTETPRIARGRVPVTIQLLSPANRPVQVTRDLASFWRTTYFEVKKDLKGRYPKHYWPDDPMQATPTSRAKPRAGK